MSRDPYGHYDAAYVLGALSPGERQEFEAHVAECERCRRAVAEIAGLPGLLARLDPAEVEHDEPAPQDAGADPVPDTLLPRLLAEVAREGRRRRTRAFTLAAAAAAAVAAVSVGVTAGLGAGPDPSAPTAVDTPARRMTQVGQDRLAAKVAMEPVAWGTRLSITCTYAAPRYADTGLPTYTMVVRTRDGSEEQVASWRAVAGRPTTVTAATAARPAEITSVEVRTTKGDPVLRLAG